MGKTRTTFLRQFTDDENGSLYEMLFEDEAKAKAYAPPAGRTEVIPAKPRPSDQHKWRDGKWVKPKLSKE